MTAIHSGEITDEQIGELRAEAAAAGDDVQVAICDVALAGALDEIAEIDDALRPELERRGIIPEHVDADVRARAECARRLYEDVCTYDRTAEESLAVAALADEDVE